MTHARAHHDPASRPERGLWLCAAGAGVLLSAVAPALGQRGLGGDVTPGLPNTTPEPLKGVELHNKLGSVVPLDLVFTADDGSPVKLGDYFGKPIVKSSSGESLTGKRPVVLLMMYFRCPMLCPMTLDRMTQSLRNIESLSIGSEFDALVVSFDERDTPKDAAQMKAAALLGYARSGESVRTSWNFLTGTAANGKALAESMGFSYRYLPESGQFAHGSVIFVLTPEGKVSRYVTELGGSSTDLRLAIIDAAGGVIGSWTDRLMLRCLHFDPKQGTYTMGIMRGVQIGAGLGTLALGGWIGTNLVRERRRRARANTLKLSAHPGGPTLATGSAMGQH